MAKPKFLSLDGVRTLVQWAKDQLATKVDKVAGKDLSDNNYSDDDVAKLESIENGAQSNIIESISVNNVAQAIDDKNVNIAIPLVDDTLTNTGQSADAKATGDAIAELDQSLSQTATAIRQEFDDADSQLAQEMTQALEDLSATIPTKTSDLTNDSNYVTTDELANELANKEDTLQYGTATAEDVGKAMIPKTVADGKVTEWEFGEAGRVDDVQINGTSILENKVANIPIASANHIGAVLVSPAYGISVANANGNTYINKADSKQTKEGSNLYRPIVPNNQHESTFYGLAKVAGHDEKDSELPVGQYTDGAKTAIQSMLGVDEFNLSDRIAKGVDNNGDVVAGAIKEGNIANNVAQGANSHAEGSNTIASGTASHAEGQGTKASNFNSHAEGQFTTASGYDSHAEGNNTMASGNYSHAEGSATIANHKSQHVFGEFNIEDPSTTMTDKRGNYVEIVGNGTKANARSNARTLDWSGNEILAGKLTVGANPTNTMDVSTKGYVDTAVSQCMGVADIDATLSTAGKAADAKKVGDEISDIKADLTGLFEVKNNLAWTAGYITDTGGIHAQASNRYQYYSELILADHFKTIVITPLNGRQVSIASYDKETGAFVSRSSYSTGKISIDNTYNVRINLTLISQSSTEVTKEEQLQNVSILQDFYLSDSAIRANNIVVETIYVQDGGATSAQQTDKYVKVTNMELKENDEITAVDGYQFAVYTSGDTLISGGWQTSYTMTAAYSGAKIVIRKPNAVESIIKETDGLTLLSYILENYKSAVNKAYVLTDLTIADIQSRIDVNKRWFNKKVAFVGDSITFGVHTTKIYYEILDEKIGFFDVYSDGVAGSSYSVTATGEYTPITQRWQSIPTDRDLVVIFAGTNDWGHDTPLGTIADTTDVSFYGAISVVINGILEANPDTRLVLMTPLHRWGYNGGNYPNDTDNNGQGHPLVDYVNAIKEIAELYGVPVIDLFSISGLNPRISAIKTGYMTDGLHPDTAGHVLLADRIEPQLETL